ncbi:MAG: nitroreductase family protein [Bacteroidales bacterium]|nr:nitroreductase family protein [Bacteroidales bacterium]
MADNYLEKRYEAVFGGGRKDDPATKERARRAAGVETLMRRNRSYREYDTSYEVKRAELEAMVRMNRYLASGRNAQTLRFRLLTKDSGSDKLQGLYKLGRALPELNLPRKGAEPQAFIVVCSTVPMEKGQWIDLGISCQGMLLKAAEMGLQGVIIRNFVPAQVRAALDLPLEPVCLIAVGKGLEKIELVDISAGEDFNYYRRDGVHYVPKLRLEDLLI